MTSFKALRDHSGEFRYLGLGRYGDFLPFISFRGAWGNAADKMLLRLSRLWRSVQAPERFAQLQAVKNLQRQMRTPFSDGLFYDHDAHGIAAVAGFVKTGGVAQFIKIFKNAEDVIFQKFQADFVATYFNGPFLTMPVTQATQYALFFHFSKRKRNVGAGDHIERKLLHLTTTMLAQHVMTKPSGDVLPLDLGSVLMRAGMQDLHERIGQWRTLRTGHIALIPIHGDVTPRNLFVNEQEKHVLVNYERAGWHVAYYDYLHYVLDRHVGEKHPPTLKQLALTVEYEGFDDVLVLYLVDQIYHELNEQPTMQIQTGLSQTLRNRRKWLLEQIATLVI